MNRKIIRYYYHTQGVLLSLPPLSSEQERTERKKASAATWIDASRQARSRSSRRLKPFAPYGKARRNPSQRGETMIRTLKALPVAAGVATALLFTASVARAEDEKKPTINVFGFLQAQVDGTTGNDTSRFFIRRSRVGIKGEINEKITYQVLNEFSAATSGLRDAFITYTKGGNSPLFRIGEFKTSYSFEQIHPDETLPLIERAIAVDELATNHDRDTGFAIMSPYQGSFSKADPTMFAYSIALQNGAGRNVSAAKATKLLSARVLLTPTVNHPIAGGQVSFGFSTRQGSVTNLIGSATGALAERERYGIEFGYLHPKWRLQGEYLWGNDLSAGGATLERNGYYLTLGRRLKENVEVLLRYEGYTPDSTLPSIHRTTLGVAYELSKNAAWYLGYEFIEGSSAGLTGGATPPTNGSGLRFRTTVRF